MSYGIYEKELDDLIEETKIIRIMFYYKAHTRFRFDKEEIEIVRKYNTKDFSLEKMYNSFYTRALIFLDKILPNRIEEFIECYKLKTITNSDQYDISTFLKRVQYINLSRGRELEAIKLFERQQSILASIKDLFNTQIFQLEHNIRQNVYGDELDSAEYLLSKEYTRASGAIAGVVLESHLKNICQKNSIVLKGTEALSQYNALLKPIIGDITWGRIDSIVRIRNCCDHAKSTEPTKDDVSLLINETRRLLNEL